ncbi:J domain-containing protein [Anthocerotibacter panamensis]|uniref:J domain-containing protein n=1 Tax=Anthocerotibacter panamensis TaxID=2857077 RepID=UPI001C407368|nr:J domain-containing protein [Anthocerotibacter panamensis]
MLKRVDYYQVLGVPPTAREKEIRQAYRRLSREYHPDTTALSKSEALEKFLVLNEAYSILSHPVKRVNYDQRLASMRAQRFQAQSREPVRQRVQYTDIQERALSSTELFALFILGFAFIASLLLVGFVSLTRV